MLGDSAYSLAMYMLVPYKDRGHLSPAETKYNKKHSQTRIIVECAFALLKGRFRRLKTVVAKLENIPNIIVCACVLHNLCLDNDDEGDDMIDYEEFVMGDLEGRGRAGENQEARNKRDYISSVI